MLALRYELFPYSAAKATYSVLMDRDENSDVVVVSVAEKRYQSDIARLISIKTPSQANQLRLQLITVLFGASGLPKSLPTEVYKDHLGNQYEGVSSLVQVDELVTEMDFGLTSIAHHFHPVAPNGKVVVYHQGHLGGFNRGLPTIGRLLDGGYAVLAYSMPLKGMNNQPTVLLPRQGNLKLTSHDHLKFLKPSEGHPIRYFIEPVLIGLNYLQRNYAYSSVAMLGISGGGWTTTLTAAVDTRIKTSFPVAGSYPIYLRSGEPRDWGDYEQTEPAILNTANYLELYVLGSEGQNRKQVQVVNLYDSCCFGGLGWKTYQDIVKRSVDQLGAGEFSVFLDETHKEHKLSDSALEQVLKSLAQSPQ